jgi:tetratricopeptide (TPR) repeat protein
MRLESSRWPGRTGAALAVAGLLAFTATAAFVPLDNNDIWIHLTTGRLILEEGAVPRVDRYSFTAEGNRYVAHEWLAAAFYAIAERVAGIPGVRVAAKLVPALALVVMLLVAVRATRAPWELALPVSVLTLTLARRRILARPDLLVMPLLLTVLWLLWRDRESARAGRRTRAIFWLVPLEAVWANLHGSFPLGIAAVLVFAFAEVAERLLAPRDRRAQRVRLLGVAAAFVVAAWLAGLEPRVFGVTAAIGVGAVAWLFAVDGFWPVFRDDLGPRGQGPLRLLGLAAAMGLAVLLNPLGAEIYAFPFEFTAGHNVITRTVNEWKPLLESDHLQQSFQLLSYWAFLGLWCGALAIGAWRGRLGRLELGCLLAFGVLPLRHGRWIALFALASTPALVALLDAARPPGDRAEGAGRAEGGGRAAAVALAALGMGFASLAVWGAVRARPDFALRLALIAAVAAPAVALALTLRPQLSLRLGSTSAAASVLFLVLLAGLHGIPTTAGRAPRAWSGPGTGRGFGASRQAQPATDFLRDAGISGRLLTEYEWAGYAIHELWPRVRVFIDSRSEVYGEAFLAEFRRAKNHEETARAVLERHAVDLVMVRQRPYPITEPRNRGLLNAIEADPRWGLIFVDDRSVVYARRDRDDALPAVFERIELRRFRPRDPGLGDPALEAELRSARARAPRSAFLTFALAASLRAQGRRAEALAELERGWAVNPAYAAVPQLAGEIAAAGGDFEGARKWFRRALRLAPDWERAQRALDALPRARE